MQVFFSELVSALKYIRKYKGYKQRQVAEALHISKSTVSEIENLSNCPNLKTVLKYAEVLKINVRLSFIVQNEEIVVITVNNEEK